MSSFEEEASSDATEEEDLAEESQEEVDDDGLSLDELSQAYADLLGGGHDPYDEVEDDESEAELPDDAEEPTINEVNFNLFPVLIVALSGEVPERTLYRRARELQDELESIPTVLEANLNGQREELLEVIIDNKRLESYQITQTELFNAVSRNNRLVAAGTFDSGRGRFSIKVPGNLSCHFSPSSVSFALS